MIVMGIDPGMKGGIALLNTDTNSLVASPTPLLAKELDYRTIFKAIQEHSPDRIVIEKVHAMPGQGVTSMFNFGYGYGALVALSSVSNARLILVTPQTWKKHVLEGTAKDKSAAIQFCRMTYPLVNLVQPRCRTPHDGVADAICLSHYGAYHAK